MERTVGIAAVRSVCSSSANPFADCLGCGDEIDSERRAAIPSALRCLTCQEAFERSRRLCVGA
ncbi:MAG: TraR/DksA family transcriptional regulator [Caulobacter sp.]|nr:TraR/DksA family transcriptional regulator [Caulobacter sp.]